MTPLILITRPRESAEAFAADLRAKLGEAVAICIAPLLKIEHIDDVPDLAPVKTLIFTSAHAVESFATATPRRDFTCYTVGEATARVAATHGFDPIRGPGTGKSLAEKILQDAPPSPCLYLRGDHVAFDIADHLNAAGLPTQSAVLYRQVPVPLTPAAREMITSSGPIVAPVFSPRSARLLHDAIPVDIPLHVAAISEAAAKGVPSARLEKLMIADTPDKTAVLTCVATLWRNAIQLEGNSTAQ